METRLKKIADQCKEARHLAGLSFRDVEKATGIDKGTVCRIESGQVTYNIAKLITLADFYNIEIRF